MLMPSICHRQNVEWLCSLTLDLVNACLVAYPLAGPDDRAALLLSDLLPPTFLLFWLGTCV